MNTKPKQLLLEDRPLIVLPSLAVTIGLNEALALQQVHYWLQRVGHEREGRLWVYNSVRQWQKDNFPFWSEDTIQRVFKRLQNLGLLLVGNFNPFKMDKTLWYAIDYDKVDQLSSAITASCGNE